MTRTLIDVRNLSKSYRLGVAGTGRISTDLSLMMKRWMSSRTNFTSESGAGNDILWSLNNVSFEVEEGDVFGIMGRNGAGKSTLLKILSKITSPTSGEVRLNGTIGSLLEVGTGFHPDLTGRENIFLNGAILGMKRAEIRARFDEIVAFSGVEKFLDTAVKRYSSGMFVRLGFAVAAHLDPDILVVDEVLAVGDYEFQQKCIGKMKDVARNGRTILFVSHSAAAIKQLCNKGLLLNEGRVVCEGPISKVLQVYQNQVSDVSSGIRRKSFPMPASFFEQWQLITETNGSFHASYSGERLHVVVKLVITESVPLCEIRMMIKHEALIVFHASSMNDGQGLITLSPGEYNVGFVLDFPIRDAEFEMEFTLLNAGRILDLWLSSTRLTILDAYQSRVNPGMLNMPAEFYLERIGSGELIN